LVIDPFLVPCRRIQENCDSECPVAALSPAAGVKRPVPLPGGHAIISAWTAPGAGFQSKIK
jgi:hypothetical protein